MAENLLEIQDLHAGVEDKEILKGLSLTVGKGEVHVILGPNGSGKSTLMNVIMGHPKYEVTAGSIAFEGEDITQLKTFERARKGLFLSFQTPEEIPGISVENMIRTAKQAVSGERVKLLPFRRKLKEMMEEEGSVEDGSSGTFSALRETGRHEERSPARAKVMKTGRWDFLFMRKKGKGMPNRHYTGKGPRFPYPRANWVS